MLKVGDLVTRKKAFHNDSPMDKDAKQYYTHGIVHRIVSIDKSIGDELLVNFGISTIAQGYLLDRYELVGQRKYNLPDWW